MELRLKSRPEKSQWVGRISYQKLNGEKVIKNINDPGCVGEEVNKGKKLSKLNKVHQLNYCEIDAKLIEKTNKQKQQPKGPGCRLISLDT